MIKSIDENTCPNCHRDLTGFIRIPPKARDSTFYMVTCIFCKTVFRQWYTSILDGLEKEYKEQ